MWPASALGFAKMHSQLTPPPFSVVATLLLRRSYADATLVLRWSYAHERVMSGLSAGDERVKTE
jgi:hypothetical protein